MILKETAAQSPADVLRGWDGICREFGCSEQQLRELYTHEESDVQTLDEEGILSDAEFAEQAVDCARGPLN